MTTLPALIEKMEPELKKALTGSTVPSERFVRIAKTAVNSNPDLANADRTSLLASITQAAQDGLVIDNKEAAIVIFKGKAQYMPMVAGLVKKMRQHSEFGSISHGIIYQNEIDQGRFEYVKGDDEFLKHDPIIFGDKGAPVGAYAVLTTKTGDKFRAVMEKEAIEKRLGKGANSQAKREWRQEFWIKTVLKQLYKIAPNGGDQAGILDGVFGSEEPEPEHTPTPPDEHDSNGVVRDAPTKAAAAVMAQADEIEDAEFTDVPEDYTPTQYDDEVPI